MKGRIVTVFLIYAELMRITLNYLFRSYRIGARVKAAGIKPRVLSVR